MSDISEQNIYTVPCPTCNARVGEQCVFDLRDAFPGTNHYKRHIEAARKLPAPTEPAPKEGEKIEVWVGSREWIHQQEMKKALEAAAKLKELIPAKVEAGDGLPLLDITDIDRAIATQKVNDDPRSSDPLGDYQRELHIAVRERQLKASLLREQKLKELLGSLQKELVSYEEEPCPRNHNGHWFDSDGNCTYCGKYDEINNLRLNIKAVKGE